MTTAAKSLFNSVLDDHAMVTRTINGVGYSLWLQDGEFVMVKQGGGANERHQLLASATDDARLSAHWEGFCGVTAPYFDPIPPKAAKPAPDMREIIEDGRVAYVPVKRSHMIRWSAGHGGGRIWVNQQWRDADLLGTAGNIALIEYEMPNGRTYLVQVDWDEQNERPVEEIQSERTVRVPSKDYSFYRITHYQIDYQIAGYKTISRRAIPKRWQSLFPVANAA